MTGNELLSEINLFSFGISFDLSGQYNSTLVIRSKKETPILLIFIVC